MWSSRMSESILNLSFDEVLDRLVKLKRPYHGSYLAMYSSWYGGIVTDPALMMVPIDDHLVHRGDGVFEAFKCVDWKVYALDRHMDRLERSARALSLESRLDRARLVRIVLATIRAAGVADCSVRLFVSRGPGGFSTNPYECPESQLYVVVVAPQLPAKEKYELGVSLKSSRIPAKTAYYASLKSCNYLPNVLMKKEAVDSGVDFTISIDERGFVGEGATENMGIITADGAFLVPRFDSVLRGTTITRAMELAESLMKSGELSRIEQSDVSPDQVYDASEVMMFGTTFDVLPVVKFDGRQVGGGKPGEIFRKILALLRDDMRSCREMQTPVKE
jgi:branched-subunit amino acid aminotransferase/4-amino-4-deoxychorismate lyase